jgi:hypothetical protein
MPQPLQPVNEAIRRGEKQKAIELIKGALSVDPYDIDMLLVLATLVEEPTRKRQVLNRVLSREPTNKTARDMLLEMDRAEMSAYRLNPNPAPPPAPKIPTQDVSSRPEFVPPPASQQMAAARPTQVSKTNAEKPIVFGPSMVWLIFLILLTSISCCGGLLIASQNMARSLPSFALALLFGLTALSLWSKVEVSGAGIRSSNLLGSTQIQWDEIASIKSNSMKRKLELVSNKGRAVSISTQVKGYPQVIEILRQKRPDLFGEARLPVSQANPPVQGYEPSPSTANDNLPAFTGTKTFKKNFFKQYGLLFALIPMCLLFAGLGLAASAETRTAFLVSAGFCALLMLIPFFQVSGVKVEPDKLTVQTFFEEKEFSVRQIKEIKMQSVHGRYGRVTNFVNIVPLEGKNYPLSGFSEGEEIIYGFLMNWWNRHQNR